MLAFLQQYPYFAASLLVLPLTALGFALCPRRHRRPMLWSALLLLPFALTSVCVVPCYWNPARVFVFIAGPEDVVFCFAAGALGWPLAVWPIHRRLQFEWRGRRVLACYVLCCLWGFGVAVPLALLGLRGLTPALIGIASLAVLLLALRRELWPMAAAGVVCSGLFYTAFAVAVFALFPGFAGQWNLENLWAVTFLGVPLEEPAWAVAAGAAWPLMMACAFNARLGAAPIEVH